MLAPRALLQMPCRGPLASAMPYCKFMSSNDHAGSAGNPDIPAFIPGLELSSAFYTEIVAPILAAAYPRLRYSAALIGYGSEVLGYDTARSTDHEWGPRLLLLVSEDDHARHAAAIDALLGKRLPPTFRGFSTHFGLPAPDGVQQPTPHTSGPIAHKIPVYPLRGLLSHWLGADPFGELTAVDWLLMPQQKLLEVTAGRVFHDGLGELTPVRKKLAWYPPAIWRYLLAAQWQRISQHEAFVGRAGEVGDELGSALIAGMLVRDVMGLGFLMERRYAPYSKWFGTAFAELACAPRLLPHLRSVQRATTWHARDAALTPVYEMVAGLHNDLEITAPVDPRVRFYHGGRPYHVIHGERFAGAIVESIDDPEVRSLVQRAGLVGSVDQVSDNVDVVSDPDRVARLRALYG
jgi:hypothetical protein